MSVVEEPRVKVHCPVCGHDREISARQRRRIANGVHDQRCFWCRTGTQRRNPDRYLRYWLLYAGVKLPPGTDVRLHVQEHGLPPMLVELAFDMWPELA